MHTHYNIHTKCVHTDSCRGLESTYEIRVGRGSSPAGPFLDKNGVTLKDNGGSLVLLNSTSTYTGHKMVGPGHAGIYHDDAGRFAFSFDYMAIDSNENVFKTQLRELVWDSKGWPVVTNRNYFP